MNNRQSLILLTAITAALAAPLSFAQSAHSGMTAQEHAAAQATTPAATTTTTEDAGAMAATPATPATPATDGLAATPATPATPASSARKVSWSALDTDSSGTLSKAETASVESLSKVFDKADANADGALSTDEYKAYLAMNGKASPNKK